MRLAPILICLALCSVAADAETTVDRVHLGRFDLVTKVEDHSDHPIMHVASILREIRLEWHSADGRVVLYLKDDGRLTTNELVARRGAVADFDASKDWGCFGGGRLYAYQSHEAPASRWKKIVKTDFSSLLTTCAEWVSPAQRAAYLNDAANAADDFGLALEAMKASAQKQFGGWRRRCIKEKHAENTWADFYCVRYSSEQN